jgi:hypothetical protein
MKSALLNAVNDGAETLIGLLPKALRQKLALRLFSSVTMMAVKA